MAELTDLVPVDDAFIRTAIRGLRAPEHHPAFWTELTGELDAVEVAMAPHRAPVRAPAPVRVAAPEPEPVPVPEPAPEPVVELEPVAAAAVHPPRREPLRARPPAHAAPAGEGERVRAFVPAPEAPTAKRRPVVHHDAAVVPQSLRRSSNAILLAIAVVAAVVALVAAVTLVRQRSDAGGPSPTEQPSADAAAAPI
jgi:hypothetical protein